VTTPGQFDLRTVMPRLPWPDVKGKRCLDVGTYDGFLAFELERRGASEVVAVDLDSQDKWDWPPDVRLTGGANYALKVGPEKGRGFRVAARALRSKVVRRCLSIYDLSPDEIGKFDVVVCGTLLLHLRDPLAALEALRSVCEGHFLSIDEVDLELTVLGRRRPLARLNGLGAQCQWWVPNAAGYVRMLQGAGFEVEEVTRTFALPFGVNHPAHDPRGMSVRRALRRRALGGWGVPQKAALCRPMPVPNLRS
jgi:tRNA (mo5U34)-methyltransferase